MPNSRPPVVVVAPDSFKGSVSAAGAAAAMARGARLAFGAAAEIVELPMADGGEGTLDALLATWHRPPLSTATTDALGRPKTARYGSSADGRVGIIEAAEGNGLPDVSDIPLQPLRADSHGVGTIAKRLLDDGAEEILLCIGGSASTDGGTGLLTALGARFLDAAGNPVAPGGGGLTSICSVDTSGLHPRAATVQWRIAVDVDNPLCGQRGAAAVFGPQKGAGPADIELLDAGLANLARILADLAAGTRPPAEDKSGRQGPPYLSTPGFGAAGGLPLALVALLGAETVPGAELVADAVGLDAALARADVVLTGEGCLDTQSLGGKVVDAVRRLAPASAPVLVVAGTVQLSAAQCREAGITAAVSIARGASTLPELTAAADILIEDAAAHICSVLAFDSAAPRSLGLHENS
ncbi:glycerate kinase [Arthrobacter zhaoxinii]|uniref:glycerate kinase n=1 Tax=Arthrobacter zhaoxinii TaxID=2964616 RepID=UPI002105797B|nr:glycerate kinase [Arthrobacter zhaoxinii]MCQ1999851.1 glycerate kinase [Arthrobacter zhaoxinii]